MANIDKELEQILEAVFGEDVRDSIHDGIKKVNRESEESRKKADEARGIIKSILDEGFDNATLVADFAHKLEEEIKQLQPEWTGFKNDVTSQLAANVQDVNNLEQSKASKSDLGRLRDYVSGVSVKDLKYPLYVAHRGGKNVFPENSIESFRHSISAGFPIEIDVRLNADGVPVIIHGSTMNRTTNRGGPVSNYPTASFVNAKITELGTEFEGTPTTLENLFSELGNKAIYVLEPKERDAVPKSIELINRYSLKDNIIFQSFVRDDLNPAIDEGLITGFLSDTEISNPYQLKQDGIDYVAMRKTVNSAAIQSCRDAGLDVWIYTVNTRYETDALLSEGVDAIISDDPLWVCRKSSVLDRDNFNQQTWYHGQFSPTANANGSDVLGNRGEFYLPGRFGWKEAADSGLDFTLQGWAGELKQNFEFTIDIFPEELASITNRWAGIAFCTQNDYYDDKSELTIGYNVIFRQNGLTQLYRKDNGASVLLAEESAPNMVAGTRLSVTITVNGNNIKIERTDSQAPNLSISVNDSTYRKGYLHLGRRMTGVTFGNGKYN